MTWLCVSSRLLSLKFKTWMLEFSDRPLHSLVGSLNVIVYCALGFLFDEMELARGYWGLDGE